MSTTNTNPTSAAPSALWFLITDTDGCEVWHSTLEGACAMAARRGMSAARVTLLWGSRVARLTIGESFTIGSGESAAPADDDVRSI